MGEIVNLRRVRKANARSEAAAQANTNRAKHGVSKAVRELATARKDKAQRDLAGRKLSEK